MENIKIISTQEELRELLIKHKNILSDAIYNYLVSLVELEFSVIRDYIGEDERCILSELEIYRKIAVYNILTRALKTLSNYKSEINLSNIKIFEFISNELTSYKEIGSILLYQTITSKEARILELARIKSILNNLYNEICPYPIFRNLEASPVATWEYAHMLEIKKYKNLYRSLSERKINDAEKQEIEIQKIIHDLLLDDYGLTSESFEKLTQDSKLGNSSLLDKILIKKIPGINIIDNIKYI